VPVCSKCGQDNPEVARFCLACGSSLDAERPALREERKVVTVLFADVVGFTSRAERMDPEDVRAMLSPYYARLRAELERFGGTVEKFIGDAVMAVFGAPVSHEDDPERAVRAALAIREALAELNEDERAVDLHVRIGVNTGEALVALGARPVEGEGMVAGDVVNTAARLQRRRRSTASSSASRRTGRRRASSTTSRRIRSTQKGKRTPFGSGRRSMPARASAWT
jgi:class 3 adenylate cyclase